MPRIERTDDHSFIAKLKGRFHGVRQNSKQPSFEGRILIFTMSFVAIFFAISAISLMYLHDEGKTPYLFDVQLKKSSALEARMRAYLMRRDNIEILDLKKTSLSPEQLFLPRWPIGNEIFVGYDNDNLVIGRYSSESLWVRPLGSLTSFWRTEDEFSYVITTGGINLGSNRPELLGAKSGMKKAEIDAFFRSGVASGTRIYKDAFQGDRIVSHREVQDTNVVVFQESVLRDSRRTSKHYLPMAIASTLLSVLFVIAVAFYFVRLLVRPVKELALEARHVSLGVNERAADHEFRDDLSKIQRALASLRVSVRTRLDLRKTNGALRVLSHQFLKAAAKARTLEEALIQAAAIIVKQPSIEAERVDVAIYFLPQIRWDSEPLTSLVEWRLVSSGVLEKEPTRTICEPPPFSRSDINLTLEGRYPRQVEQAVLLCPIVRGASNLGFVAIRRYTATQLSSSEKEWLRIVGQILGEVIFLLPKRS